MFKRNAFRFSRIYLLVRNAVLLNRSSIAIVAAAAAGVLLLISFVDAFGACRAELHRNLYLVVLFLGGLLLTSRSFKELHDPVKGISWLLVPASLLEKTLAWLLLTTLVFILGSMGFYLAFSVISEGLNMLAFGRRHFLFFPFDPFVLKGALSYTAIQAPFFLGAVYFRKHALSKTILALLTFSLMLGLGVLVVARVLFWGQGIAWDFEAVFAGTDLSEKWAQLANLGKTAAVAAKSLFWAVVPFVCWTTCYFRLKETER